MLAARPEPVWAEELPVAEAPDAEPSGAEAPFEAAEAVQPAAGTAVGALAPSAGAGVVPLAAGTVAGAVGTEAAAAGQPEAVAGQPASGIAAAAVRQAAQDGPAVLPVLMERQLQAVEIPAVRMAAPGPVCRRGPGRAVRDGHLVPAADPPRRASEPARCWATGERPGGHPALLLVFVAPAAHYPA